MLTKKFKSVLTFTDNCYLLIGCRIPFQRHRSVQLHLRYSVVLVECIGRLTACVIVQLYLQ